MDMNNIKEKLVDFYQAKKRLVWIGSGVLLILAAAIVIFIPRSNTVAENIQVVQVSRGSIIESISEVGNVEAQPSAIITWQSSGVVGEFDLQVGDHVKKDDLLIELELSSWSNESLQAQSALLDARIALENLLSADSDFQTALQTLSDAEWTLIDKKADRDAWNYGGSSDERIDAVLANYESAKHAMWVLESDYEALRKILDEDDPALIEAYETIQATDLERDSYLRALNQILGHPYDLDVETDFIEYDQARAAVGHARAAYKRLLDNSQEIAAAEANVLALQNMINMAKIIAPFDGTVTEISIRPGEMIQSGARAVQLDDLDNLVVNVDVSEIDISKVEIGHPVVITFDALPYREFSGFVSGISSAGMDKSGTVEFRVTVTIEDADESVKTGFTAVVSIITSQTEDVLLVPNQALRNINGNNSVVVLGENGDPMPVRVEVGASSEAFTEIISEDIAEGNQLIVVTESIGSGFGGGFGIMGGMRQVTGGGGGKPSDQQK
jgi:HlyD family secretion protein